MPDLILLTPDAVAKRLGIPVKTLYWWRTTGVGPPAYRLGRHLRYSEADIEAWLAERRSPAARLVPVGPASSTKPRTKRRRGP
jgi:excisionase family DNA binding protein